MFFGFLYLQNKNVRLVGYLSKQWTVSKVAVCLWMLMSQWNVYCRVPLSNFCIPKKSQVFFKGKKSVFDFELKHCRCAALWVLVCYASVLEAQAFEAGFRWIDWEGWAVHVTGGLAMDFLLRFLRNGKYMERQMQDKFVEKNIHQRQWSERKIK